jgi:hypothetical protein
MINTKVEKNILVNQTTELCYKRSYFNEAGSTRSFNESQCQGIDYIGRWSASEQASLFLDLALLDVKSRAEDEEGEESRALNRAAVL